MENSYSDYIGLLLLVAGVGGALWFFWSKIRDRF